MGHATINILAKLRTHFSDQRLTKIETVQSLWSGYGEIARYLSPRLKQTFIVKHVWPPNTRNHPRGWNTDIGHQRKLASYQVEANFYQYQGALCDEHCIVPKLLADFSEDTQQVLVLQDMDQMGFSKRKNTGNLEDVKQGIRWLAYFHGRFLNESTPQLWPIGTYWHLATRQDEYQVMQASELKEAASAIDTVLNKASFQSLVHGDAKLANFCFPDEDNRVGLAAVDFQYVGRGVGMKDVAYFLGACLDSNELYEHEQWILKDYFQHLKSALAYYQVPTKFDALEAEWRSLYSFAWADFYRFLMGWSPEHYKINPYMQQQTDVALATLKRTFE